jgi:hypothetical protein
MIAATTVSSTGMRENLLERTPPTQHNPSMTPSRRCHAAPLIAATLLLSFSLTKTAHACACCTDPGEYEFVANAPITEYQRAQLDDLRFSEAAQLYLTDAGEDGIKGLASIAAENTVIVIAKPKQWQMTFRAADGQTGTLRLTKPTRMTTLAADIHDSESSGVGPSLYKEWRCEGVVQGDGIFGKSFTTPARYTLIFQGRGNRCHSSSDFTHWRLEVSGKAASYAFFGKLKPES